jgi:nucleoside-diphosphate-sugar epimerase
MSQALIVLTGATGRLGAPVHRTLLEAGKNVRATDRIRAISSTRPVIKANLLDPVSCRRILQDAKVLVHLAYRREPYGYPNGYPHRTFDDHIRLNRTVFLAACQAGVKKIIFSSSIQVVARQLPLVSASQPPRYLPLDENSPPEPDNWYSLAKRCSEEMLAMLRRQYGIDYVILRFPSLFNTVPLLHPERVQGRLSEGHSYLSYRDAANLVLKIIDADLPGGHTYLPASRKNALGRPVTEIIRDYYTGVPTRKPAAELEGLVDISTLSREIGWEPLELSQPEVEPFMPLVWRFYGRVGKLVPKSLKPFVERILSAFES